METRFFALLIGLGFLVLGLLGFVPGAVHLTHEVGDLRLTTGYGVLFGIFPVNLVLDVVHLAIGIAGIAAYRSLRAAVRFSRGLAVFFGALAILGLLPGLRTIFGLLPLFGNDVWLHGLTAIIAAYFGWAQFAPPGRVPTPHHA
jgi:hypothetical protein